MQPLDVGFNGPLNINFGKEVNSFQRQGNRVTLKNLYSIFGKAFLQSAKMDTAINSFRRCGIYPYNPEVFPDSDFTTKSAVPSNSTPRSKESEERIEGYEEMVRDIMKSNEDQNSTSTAPSANQAQLSMHQAQPSMNHQPSTQQAQASRHQAQPSIKSPLSTPQAHPDMQPGQPDSQEAQPSTYEAEEVNARRADDEVRIPLSYLTQAMPLINLLSSAYNKSITQDSSKEVTINTANIWQEDHVDKLLINPSSKTTTDLIVGDQPVSSLHTDNLVPPSTSTSGKSKKVKGKAAIVTSDAYKEELMTAKIRNIKKEKVQKNISETVVKPKNEPRKRKAPSTATVPMKVRKPLEQLNVNQPTIKTIPDPLQLIMTNNVELLENEKYLTETIPESTILTSQSTFLDGQPVEICYVDENTIKALNLQLI